MKKRVCLIHHNLLKHRGGGDLTAAWILEALKDDYDLTYITWGDPVDLKEVDQFYGTHLAASGMKVNLIPSLTRLGFTTRPFRLIIALMERYMKCHKDEYDIPFSTYNEIDFGKRGIQFVQGPSRSDKGASFYLPDYKPSALRTLYHKFCYWFSDFKFEHITRNMTLVKDIDSVESLYGILPSRMGSSLLLSRLMITLSSRASAMALKMLRMFTACQSPFIASPDTRAGFPPALLILAGRKTGSFSRAPPSRLAPSQALNQSSSPLPLSVTTARLFRAAARL